MVAGIRFHPKAKVRIELDGNHAIAQLANVTTGGLTSSRLKNKSS